MPQIRVNGVTIHYEEYGSGPETIVFAHGLLWSGRMFDHQVNSLRDRYRCITFDFRGQGQSEIAESGYDIDTLTLDAAALIEALHCIPCHFVGLSMGGFVGMRLAIHRPDLIRSLILIATSADPEPRENIGRYRLLNFVARWFGLRLVADQVMPIMFGKKFLSDPLRAQERELWRERMIANHRLGISRAVQGVIDRQGVYDLIDQIHAPTLIIVGDQDVATPPDKARRIHERIRNSKFVVISGAGHTATVEEPESVSGVLKQFLSAG